MTSTPPPGWYPDPSGQQGTRWWDGTAWTQHVGPQGGQYGGQQYSAAGYSTRPQVPDSTRTDTVFIRVLAFLPLISLLLVSVYQPHYQYTEIGPEHIRTVDPRSIYTPGYFLLMGVSLLVYAAAVVLAFLDRRELEQRGVVRPFPWPWAFLSGIVYVIGRFVVVRKVAPGRPMWPLWIFVALSVIGAVIGIVDALSQVRQVLP